MIEITLFVLIIGLLICAFLYMLGLMWFPAEYIFFPLLALTLPGLFASFTTAPFVPSSRKRVKTMLELADAKPDDIVYDLGCGDGRLVFACAPHVKKSTGYDVSIPLVWFGKLKALITRSKAKILYGNIFKQNVSDATVVFCYLLPKAMERFYKEIWPTLKPGTRVVANAFSLKELTSVKKEEGVYLYVK